MIGDVIVNQYKLNDVVWYRGRKYKIIHVSRMGELMINVLGYNKWVCHLELKPVIRFEQ